MSFVICEKHNKVEKIGAKVAANGYICMNRYCPNAFTVFCAACKNEHRDHAIKVLTIEDVCFLTDRLLKTPLVQVGRYVGEAVEVMKKLKLIKEFRRKIELLEREIQKEAIRLIDTTESLIHEYAACKGGVEQLEQKLATIDQPLSFESLVASSKQLLANLDYNAKKDKLEYGNAHTREKEERRRKCVEYAKHKIEEVKDYTMKIIQVILHNGDSSEEEDDIAFTKKHYQLLKRQIIAEKTELELQSQISELKNSKSTANRSRVKNKNCESKSCQTYNELMSKQEVDEEIQFKLNQMRSSHMRVENDLRLKISIVAKEKENTNKDVGKFKLKLEEKKKQIGKLQQHLRKNLELRQEKEKERIDTFNRIIQLTQWKGLSLEDRFD